MKNLWLLLCLVLLCSCAAGTTSTNYTGPYNPGQSDPRHGCNWFEAAYKEAVALSDQCEEIKAQCKSSGKKELLPNLLSACQALDSKSNEIYAKWRQVPFSYKGIGRVEYDMGQTAHEYASQAACVQIIDTAQLHAQAGQKDIAKQLYRQIITNYTGNMYKGFVKKAEFGLEDLK
jgi:hypothetical protein